MGARILIVDDNPTNLKLASQVLELEGHDVIGAVDAEHALSLLEDDVPDLILMDIALPGMDGLALTRRLKAQRRFHGLPIVGLSAYALKGDEQKALDAGCDGYISKPMSRKPFLSLVAAHLAAPPTSSPVVDKTS